MLIKTVFLRLDIDQNKKKKEKRSEFFEYEAHIFFDDAISALPNGSDLNIFVQGLVSVIEEAAM